MLGLLFYFIKIFLTDDSSFLIKQIEDEKLLVEVAWFGPDLDIDFYVKLRGQNPVMVVAWWPSTFSGLEEFKPISFPLCFNHEEVVCNYELHPMLKYIWTTLKKKAPIVMNVNILKFFIFVNNNYHN